jgi:Na+/phosphate symporter
MSNNVYSIEKYRNKNDGYRVASALKMMAWAILAIGTILFSVSVSDFSSRNLGLMVGIGFLIAGMQIYGIGTIVHLLHSKPIKSKYVSSWCKTKV